MKIIILHIIILLCANFSSAQLNIELTATENTKCNGSPCNYNGPTILINEIMVSPEQFDGSISGTFVGPGGGLGEWIELYNPDICESIDISCYYLGNSTFEGNGGFSIPQGTIVPPSGFVVLRGARAPQVPPNRLVQNGGNVIEIVVPATLSANNVCSSGDRVWFPNAGGWFAFYDRNGVPQDAVRWGSQNTSDLGGTPCRPPICGNASSLASYNNIPANRKNYASNIDASNHLGMSIRRIPDGGDWSGFGFPTYANCNTNCIPPGLSTCDGTISVSVTNGTVPYSYVWNDPLIPNSSIASELCAGVYTVTVTDNVGQTASASIEVENFIPEVENNIDLTVCVNDSPIELLPFVTPNPANNEQGVFNGNGIIGNRFSPQNAGVGTHNIRYTFRDQYACQNLANGSISVLPLPELSVSNYESPYCLEDDTTEFVFTPPGGQLLGNNVTDNQILPSSIGPGTHQYNYSYTDENGCSNSLEFAINVLFPPDFSFPIANEVCINDDTYTLNIEPSGGETTINGITSNSFIPNELGLGEHLILYTYIDENGCLNEVEKNVEVFDVPSVIFEPEELFSCPPIDVDFEASIENSVSCFWDFGDGFTSTDCMNISHNYTQGGNYTVTLTATSEKGCTTKVSRENTVNIYPVPETNFNYSPNPITLTSNTVNFTNLTINGVDFYWEITGLNFLYTTTEKHPIVEFPTDAPDIYTVLLYAESEGNCPDSITKRINVESELLIYVPNAFTPNDDENNNTWRPIIEPTSVSDFSLVIYNRWGELIWQSSDPTESWDGYYKGKRVQSGTYVWNIKARDNFSAKTQEWHGHVTVLY